MLLAREVKEDSLNTLIPTFVSLVSLVSIVSLVPAMKKG